MLIALFVLSYLSIGAIITGIAHRVDDHVDDCDENAAAKDGAVVILIWPFFLIILTIVQLWRLFVSISRWIRRAVRKC